MMTTYTSFCDGGEVPDNDLKHVLLLIRFVKEKVSYGSDG